MAFWSERLAFWNSYAEKLLRQIQMPNGWLFGEACSRKVVGTFSEKLRTPKSQLENVRTLSRSVEFRRLRKGTRKNSELRTATRKIARTWKKSSPTRKSPPPDFLQTGCDQTAHARVKIGLELGIRKKLES